MYVRLQINKLQNKMMANVLKQRAYKTEVTRYKKVIKAYPIKYKPFWNQNLDTALQKEFRILRNASKELRIKILYFCVYLTFILINKNFLILRLT